MPEDFRGQRRLGGYSPRGHKELDTTKSHTHTGPPCCLLGFREGKSSQGSEWGGTLACTELWLAYAGPGAELFHSNLSIDSQKDPGRYCPQTLLQLEKLRLRASSEMAGGTLLRSGRPEAGGTLSSWGRPLQRPASLALPGPPSAAAQHVSSGNGNRD